jgi:UDP-GlcNAc:undecaprenyl-phosphate/decaprenyl-phosphate GlcNAc-1-phosphate transferase
MLISNYQYLTVFILSFILVGALTPVMRKVAIKNNIFDLPNTSHKSHTLPTPYLGGIAIMLGVVLVSLLAVLFSTNVLGNLKLLLSVLIPALLLGLIGLWDDLKSLPAYPRLFAQSVVGVCVSIILITTGTVGNPTGSIVLDVLLTVIWIVGICNSINFFDNMDGGAAGAVAFSSLGLAFLAWNLGQSLLVGLALVTAGATFGFLIWNKSPAKIYMGDAGALFLGVLLATLAIRLDPITQSRAISLSIPLLLLALPILDTTTVVISRLRSGVSIFQGGQDHLSHRLVNIGLTRKSAVIVLWLLCILFVVTANLVSMLTSTFELIFLLLGAIIWFALLLWFLKIPAGKKI